MINFDAYHKWLEIPLKDQPPDHYRRLGIERFEDDGDVIDVAANKQMRLLKEYAHGEHGETSQKVLNEAAAARLCLLNRQQKAEYDAHLRQRFPKSLVERRLLIVGAGAPLLLAVAVYFAMNWETRQSDPVSNDQRVGPLAKSDAAENAVVAPGSAVVAMEHSKKSPITRPSPEDDRPGETGTLPSEVGEHQSDVTSASKDSPVIENSPPDAEPTYAQQPRDHKPTPTNDSTKAAVDKTDEPATPTIPPSVTDGAHALDNARPSRPVIESANPDALPLPSEGARAEAAKAIREAYKRELAGRPADKRRLVEELLKAAETEAAPEMRCELLKLASETAIAGGAFEQAFAAQDLLERTFQIDVVSTRTELLSRFTKSASPEQAAEIVWQSLGIVHRALLECDERGADRVLSLAALASKKSRIPWMSPLVISARKDLSSVKPLLSPALEAISTLEADGTVQEAHWKLGLYLAAAVSDWPQALQHLENGSDEHLAQLAKSDRASPSKVDDQMRLADAWNKLATDSAGALRTAYQHRARHWLLVASAHADTLVAKEAKQRAARLPKRPWAMLINVVIDGGDVFKFSESEASWKHLSWDAPQSVLFTGQFTWDLRQGATLQNSGRTWYAPAGLNFEQATLVKTKGRGSIQLKTFSDCIEVHFGDGDLGADRYECLIRFPD